jgi:predicted nucleotide-binding protein
MYHGGTSDGWMICNYDEVRRAVYEIAGDPDLELAKEFAKSTRTVLEDSREEIISLLTTALEDRDDPFLIKLKEQAEKAKAYSASDFVKRLRPTGHVMSRDSEAIAQGFQTPPHIAVLVETMSMSQPASACRELAKVARRAASHLAKRERYSRRKQEMGTNVFIGHGRSPVWRDLKDFVQDRLKLPWDEFNRIPVVGITNIDRLLQMLDDAAIAFLIMTAEDEQADGKMRARENVVHEAGLFQGRLGFSKAIVLLEEGCEEFSNIHGWGQIRFPKEDIRPAFEEIRRVLEREGLIEL